MARRSLRQRVVRFVTAMAVGGTAMQLSGCDSNVRDALVTGLETTTQSLSSALISAFFLTLDSEDTNVNGITTT